MKTAFIFGLVLLGVFQIDARHAAKKKSVSPARGETATRAEETAENIASVPGLGGFAFPGFRIRIPIVNFGVLGRMKEQIENIMGTNKSHELPADSETAGYKGKTKTRTKTSNSTHGPFKTYTVTTETVAEGNKTVQPKVISKLVKSVTTIDKTRLPGKGKEGVGLPFNWGPQFGMKSDDLENIQGEKCSSSSDCKENKYCDALFSVCKKRFQPGTSCTQKDACDSKAGRYRCTWGRCVLNSYDGSAGTFCDSDSECHAMSAEELGCTHQPDLSRFTGVCTPKLSEGSTCGRAGIFDLFKQEDELSSRCKAGLECRVVGFYGRKACIRHLSDGLSDKNDEPGEEEGSSDENDEPKEHERSRKHKVESSIHHSKKDKKLTF